MYAVLGFALVSPQNIIRYLFIRVHHLGPTEIAAYGGLMAFPWSIKPVYGMLSDNIRQWIGRKYQISFGYCFSALCFALLSFFRSIGWCIFLLTLTSLFLGFSDVVQDSIMVARSKDSKGRIQSIAWAFRSFGSLLGCIFGATFTFHANRFAFIALMNVAGAVVAFRLKNSSDTTAPARGFLKRFCSYIKSKKVVLFACILFLYSYEPGDGFVVEYLLIQRSNIKPSFFSLSDIVSYLMVMAGSMVFSWKLRDVSIYNIICFTNSVAFILFAYRNLYVTERLSMNAEAFLIVNSIVGAFTAQLSFLPMIVVATSLSPEGMEGTIYSFFMAVSNASGIISRELSGVLTNALGIRKSVDIKLQQADTFYIICIILDLLGLIGVFLLLKYVIVDSTSQSTNDALELETVRLPKEEDTDPLEVIDLQDVDLNDSDTSAPC
jgi:MFS family permease